MVAALLSLAAGLAKVRSPESAVSALDSFGIPARALPVRGGAAVEVGLAVTVLVTGWTWASGLLAATFAGFAAFVAAARRRPAMKSCGCFGGEGEQPTVRHVVINAFLAVLIALATAAGPWGVARVVEHQPLAGLPFVILAVVTAWLAYLALDNGQARTPMRRAQ